MINIVRVPVLMYHSVGVKNSDWRGSFLTCHYKIFENHLKWFKRKKYQSITLDEYYGYIFESGEIPKNSIILTFDDGYVDNYIYAFPLLKKYGFKGVIFVTTDFVSEDSIVRKKYDFSPNFNHNNSTFYFQNCHHFFWALSSSLVGGSSFFGAGRSGRIPVQETCSAGTFAGGISGSEDSGTSV